MKNIFNALWQRWIDRRRYDRWVDMPDHLLVFFFVGSSLPSLYWGYVLQHMAPIYLKTANAVGFSLAFVVVSGVMLLLLAQAMFHGCIAKRSGELLYERWFK